MNASRKGNQPQPPQKFDAVEYPASPQQQGEPRYASPEVEEYDRLQAKARLEYDKELQAIEATNPHTLYTDVVTKRSAKGTHPVTLFGRPIDLAMLENYLVFKISPKTIVSLIKYNDVKSIEETKGYGSRRPIGSLKLGKLWVIIGAVALLAVGAIFLMYGGDIGEMMKGVFGGMI